MTIFEEVGQFRPVLTIFWKRLADWSVCFRSSISMVVMVPENKCIFKQPTKINFPTMLNEEIFKNYLNFFWKYIFFYQKIPSTALYNTLYDARLLNRRFQQISTYTIFRTYLFYLGSGSAIICGSTNPDPRGKISTKNCKKTFFTF